MGEQKYVDLEQATVEEIIESDNAAELIKTHVGKWACEDCGAENLAITDNGWTNRYTCDCGNSVKNP